VSIEDRVVLALMASFELCTDRILGFMGYGKPSSFVTTLSSRTSLLRVVAFIFGRGMKHQDDSRAGYHSEPRLHPRSRGPGSA
jgi:hypothetical protein